MKHDCPTCQCDKSPPSYPITCPYCGVTYGPGGQIPSHRMLSVNCNGRALKNKEKK